MSIASYSYPRKILFGSGASLNLSGELPSGAKVLVVAGTTVAKSPSGRKVLETIAPATCTVYTGVPPEPPLETVDELLAIGRKYMVNTVVAVGGGSVIDAAKAAAGGLCFRTSSSSAERTVFCGAAHDRRHRSGDHQQCGSDGSGKQDQAIASASLDGCRCGGR